MNILYVCTDKGIPLRGAKGASAHVRQISAALQAKGHDLTLAVRSMSGANPDPAVARIVELSAPQHDQATQVADLINAHKCSVVLERYALTSGSAAAACAALHVPLVYEVNAPIVLEAARYRGLEELEAGLAREQGLFNAAAAAVVVSSALSHYVSTVAPALPVAVVSNGVDLARFTRCMPRTDRGDRTIRIGFVGSMKPWHGVEELVTAFAELALREPSVRLVLAGHGPSLASVRAAVDLAHLADRVDILGEVRHDQVPSVLATLDLAVAPYRATEDFYFSPLKVLEYLAAGLPVVYPKIGDLPFLVGQAGLGYPPDDGSALVACLGRLVGDAGLRARLGAAAVEHAQSFGWAGVAARVTATLENVVPVRSCGGAA